MVNGMLCLFIVLVIEIIFLVIEYTYARAVFVNPSFLSMIVITSSTILGLIGNYYWGVEISPLLIPVILLGMMSLFFSDVFAKKTTKKINNSISKKMSIINIKNNRDNIVLIIVIMCTLLYAYDILRTGASKGHGGLSAIYAVKRDRSGTSLLIRQGIKLVMAAMFVHIYVFVNNVMILGKRSIKQFKHLIPAVCAIICCIFTSVRTEIFRVITALMVCLCILLFQKWNWNMKTLNRFVKKLIPYVTVGVVLLVGVRFIVKGTENATSNTYGVFMYVAYYLGTPMVVLGSKLHEGIDQFKGIHFGEITLNQFYGLLRKLGLFSNDTFLEGSKNVWIDERNRITANVDTIFGPPTIDFGMVGMAIYIFILFFLLNRFYYKNLYRTQDSRKRNSKLITYSFLASIPSMAFYTNYLNQFLTVYFVLTFILIKVLERYYGMIPSLLKANSYRKNHLADNKKI